MRIAIIVKQRRSVISVPIPALGTLIRRGWVALVLLQSIFDSVRSAVGNEKDSDPKARRGPRRGQWPAAPRVSGSAEDDSTQLAICKPRVQRYGWGLVDYSKRCESYYLSVPLPASVSVYENLLSLAPPSAQRYPPDVLGRLVADFPVVAPGFNAAVLGLGRSGLLKRFCSTSPYVGLLLSEDRLRQWVLCTCRLGGRGCQGWRQTSDPSYCICQRTLNSQLRGEPKGPNVASSRRRGRVGGRVEGWRFSCSRDPGGMSSRPCPSREKLVQVLVSGC
jgi:hypothetical protein